MQIESKRESHIHLVLEEQQKASRALWRTRTKSIVGDGGMRAAVLQAEVHLVAALKLGLKVL